LKGNSDRIAKIVASMMACSRQGENAPFAEVEFSSLIENVVSLVSYRLDEKGVKLHLPQGGSAYKLFARSAEISQVLLNLINNSIDAVSELNQKWIRLELESLGDRTRIRVIDSGMGISPANVDKIWDPFFTTKETGSGTGMGLAMSYGIVQQHGGQIYYDTESKNTTFVIELPAHASRVLDTVA
jgi:C4-dicarboxylate-specific signal transduction histidine kinase